MGSRRAAVKGSHSRRRASEDPDLAAERDSTSPGLWAEWRAGGWALVCILLLGAILRGLYLVQIADEPDFIVPQVDADYHNYWARGLAFGDWTPKGANADPLIQTTPFFRPPGYPYFLALLYKMFGPGYLLPRVFQMSLGLLNVALAFALGKRIFGRAVGLVFAGMMATYWTFLYFEAEFQEPVLLTSLLLALVLALWRWFERPSLVLALFCGINLGLLALIRPNTLLLLPLAVAWFLWSHRRRVGERPLLLPLALLVLAALLTIAPATWRNWKVAHDFVPISSNGGINLLIGNNAEANGLVYANTEAGVLDTCYDWPEIVHNMEVSRKRSLRHSEVSKHMTQQALTFMREHPWQALTLAGRKTLLFWGPSEAADNKEVHGERAYYALLRFNPWSFPLALALAVGGIALFLYTRPRGVPLDRRSGMLLLILTLVVVWFLSFVPFGITSRYRVPIVPFLLLFGASFVVALAGWVRARQWRSILTFGVTTAAFGTLAAVNWAGYQPSMARWHYQRGLSWSTLERMDKAIVEFEAALGFNPRYAAVANDLGGALAKSGNLGEAARWLRRAIELNPRNATAYYNLGAVLEHLGRYDESEMAYQSSLRLRPNHRGSAQGLARVQAARR